MHQNAPGLTRMDNQKNTEKPQEKQPAKTAKKKKRKVMTLRMHKLEAGIARGLPVAQAMRDAGYSKSSARTSTGKKGVMACKMRVLSRVLSGEQILSGLTSELVSPDARASDRIRVYELLGKHHKLWDTTQSTTQTAVFTQIINEMPTIGSSNYGQDNKL